LTVDEITASLSLSVPSEAIIARVYVFAVYHLEEEEEEQQKRKRRIDVCIYVMLAQAVQMTRHMQ
jgi:hypothetical protein